jgi:predicted MPP superfamily phosphohydrolase
VAFPFIGPTRLPPLGRKYHTGAYDVNGMFLYTNRGLGMVKPHVRFNCRPEITLFTLSPKTAA